jgi:hypothetical protein
MGIPPHGPVGLFRSTAGNLVILQGIPLSQVDEAMPFRLDFPVIFGIVAIDL